jgi:hypothetical protein
MGVNVPGRAMTVAMEMQALAAQATQHIGAQEDQHDPDGRLQPQGETFRQDAVNQKHGATDQEERGSMAQTPGQAEPEGAAEAFTAAGERRNRRQVVSLKGMAHAYQEANEEDGAQSLVPSPRGRSGG